MTPYTYFNRPAAAALYQALITEDPFYITLKQRADQSADPENPGEAMLRYMDYAMTEAREHGVLVLTEDRQSGAGIWSTPGTPEKEKQLSARKKDFIQTHLGQESLAAYTRIVEFMDQQSRDVVAKDAWYLSILGVSPKAQGKGMGRELMDPVLKKTDAVNRSVFIESFTPKNFGFYEHLGFKQVKLVSEPVTGSDYAIMVREPGT